MCSCPVIAKLQGEITITENDAAAYTTEAHAENGSYNEASKSYTITIPEDGDTVAFTNTLVTRKLRIKKTGDDTEGNGLAEAVFNLTGGNAEGFENLTGLTSMDGTADRAKLGYLPGNDNADDTLFVLPIGTYTLEETTAPQYYDTISGTVQLNVTAEGISIAKVGTDEEAPFDEVSISEPDADGIYTLTVTDTRKKATVTVIKNVTGTDADKDAQYQFISTGLTDTPETFQLYGRQKTEGEQITQANSKAYSDVPYGTVISFAETEYSQFNTAIRINNNDAEMKLTGRETGDITVNGDVTVTYTNTRNQHPAAIYKTGLGEDETITTGASFELYKASDFNDVSQKLNTGAVPVTQGTTNENGILILGNLPIDPGAEFTEYRLIETAAPSGYIRSDKAMKIFVYPDRVTGIQGTGNMLIKNATDYLDITDPSTIVIHVWNNPGAELPHTGGIGTGIFRTAGLALMLGAALILSRRIHR